MVKKRLSFLIVSCLFCIILFAQESKKVEYIENAVIKNILIFRIKTTPIVENNLNGNFLKPHTNFLSIIPDFGFKMVLELKEINFDYPDSTYRLYAFFKKYDRFKRDSIFIESDFTYFYNDRYFLVGMNPEYELKFISGNFFLSSIKKDFKLDIKKPESFNNYIKFKTFNLQTDNIIFIKKKKKKLFFNAYSSELKREINIIINTDNMDNILIEYIE